MVCENVLPQHFLIDRFFFQAFVHGMYEPGESFHTEPQAFSTGSLDGKNGQNKVFLGRIFRMATVFYCLAV